MTSPHPFEPPGWLRGSVVYQVYVRSFADGNNDGIGDLAGLARHLPYLQWLGVEVLWLSPITASAQRDFGYDTTDYTRVDPTAGTLEDLDSLLTSAHARGMRVLLDLVPNHTSDQHPWFAESSSSRQSAKRDWYLWADPSTDGSPPNNWRAVTGGSAWTLEARTNQYYLASFLSFQPDLNWRNRYVRDAFADIIDFWLDRGVDGFRIDMVDYLLKDPCLRDEPVDEFGAYEPALALRHLNQDDLPDLLRELRDRTRRNGQQVALLGEVEYHLPLERVMSYYGTPATGPLLDLPFNFELLFTPFTALSLGRVIDAIDSAVPAGAEPSWVWGSHDVPRLATRLGPDRSRAAQLILLTLRGCPVLYHGDELGLPNGVVPPTSTVDPWGAVDSAAGRDPARTPMPWTSEPNHGFTSPDTEPWLPTTYETESPIDVASQQHDPNSTLTLVRALITMRKEEPALRMGAFRLLDLGPDLLAYERRDPQQGNAFVIVVNCGAERATFRLEGATLLLRTTLSSERNALDPEPGDAVDLSPSEGCMLVEPDCSE